jgi:hypothetical protein
MLQAASTRPCKKRKDGAPSVDGTEKLEKLGHPPDCDSI